MIRTAVVWLFLASVALCQAPTITLPASVDATSGKFLRIPATTNGKVVKWFATDPTLDIFPIELLRDTNTAVVIPQRSCSLWAYTALGDVPSELAVCKIVVGGVPPPDPPVPPVPPDPPIPPPVPDVISDVYHVGKLAYSASPNDPDLAKKIAQFYRAAAGKLFGQGGQLADIVTALKTVDSQFAAKQCRDLATCDKWAVWKSKVGAALKAEQMRRGSFTRQDWYAALIEIAAAIEQVKL